MYARYPSYLSCKRLDSLRKIDRLPRWFRCTWGLSFAGEQSNHST